MSADLCVISVLEQKAFFCCFQFVWKRLLLCEPSCGSSC